MGKITKLLGFTTAVGAAVCGAAYVKKKKGISFASEEDLEYAKANPDQKIFGFEKDSADDGTKKFTVSFNKSQALKTVDSSLDTIGDAVFSAKDKMADAIGEERIDNAKNQADKFKNKVVDKIGEDKINKAKDRFDDVSGKAKDTWDTVSDKAKNKASEIFTEEKIDNAKEKVGNAFNKTKDKIKDVAGKVTKKTSEVTEDDFVDEDIIDVASDEISEVTDAIDETLTDTAETFTKEPDFIIDDTADAVKEELNEVKDSIDETLDIDGDGEGDEFPSLEQESDNEDSLSSSPADEIETEAFTDAINSNTINAESLTDIFSADTDSHTDSFLKSDFDDISNTEETSDFQAVTDEVSEVDALDETEAVDTETVEAVAGDEIDALDEVGEIEAVDTETVETAVDEVADIEEVESIEADETVDADTAETEESNGSLFDTDNDVTSDIDAEIQKINEEIDELNDELNFLSKPEEKANSFEKEVIDTISDKFSEAEKDNSPGYNDNERYDFSVHEPSSFLDNLSDFTIKSYDEEENKEVDIFEEEKHESKKFEPFKFFKRSSEKNDDEPIKDESEDSSSNLSDVDALANEISDLEKDYEASLDEAKSFTSAVSEDNTSENKDTNSDDDEPAYKSHKYDFLADELDEL